MFSHPLDLPLGLTAGAIPLVWVLGHLSGNVSWVDRSWPFWPVICSAMVAWWGYQEQTGRFDDSMPRLACMLGLQLVWSARLTSNAIRRDFYDLTSEDYRYVQFRKLVPGWFFEIIHIVVIAIAQPALLFALCLPLYSVLITPSSPSGFRINIYDILLVLSGLTLVYIEYISDNAMFAYQTAKHSSKSTENIQPRPATSSIGPKPAPYPRESHPGFITSSLFRFVRHPNFAAEQLFWLNQALFAVNAGLASGVSRDKWLKFGLIFAPPFALSLLFCSSTFLTEWITTKKYPTYRRYKRLVGQFLPQETMWTLLWAGMRGTLTEDAQEVFVAPK